MFASSKYQSIPSIIEQNKDMETFVVQGTATRVRFFGDKYQPLQFVHLSDAHAVPELWERMVEYVNYYCDFILFALHTGDYCGGSQQSYVDFYKKCSPCVRPILNCVGNHDTYKTCEILESDKKTVHGMLFPKTDDWSVTFMEGECSMTYFKDFPESNIRLVVLDNYYGGQPQLEWLSGVLDEARQRGYHTITASHEILSPIVNKLDVTFQTLDDLESIGGNSERHPELEEMIVDFKRAGGIHVCHLAGHEHSDMIGYTESGIFTVVVECATNWNGWCDGKRIRGTRTYDCFNVTAVDTERSFFKITRIGNNADYRLRSKRTLCYDYENKKVVWNG